MFSGPCAVFSVCPAAVTAVAHLVCPGTVAGLQGGLGRASCCTGLCIPAPGPVYSHPPSSCPLSSTPPPPLHLLSPPRHPAPPAPQQPARHQQRVHRGRYSDQANPSHVRNIVGKHQEVTTQRLVHASNSQCPTPDEIPRA